MKFVDKAIRTQTINFQVEITASESTLKQYEQLRAVHTRLLKQILWLTDPTVKLVCCTQVETAPRTRRTHAQVKLPYFRLNKEVVKQMLDSSVSKTQPT